MNSSVSFSRVVHATTLSFSLLLFAFASVFAQQRSTDGATPLGLSPGAPAGSYTMSDFEDVNLFNGTLNFSLPVVAIKGRGGAGYPLTVRIDQKWLVQKEQSEGQTPINIYTPWPNWWTELGWRPVYSMGRMDVRQGGSRDYVIGGPTCGYVHRQTLTRLTFTAPDGTEFELRDQATNGQPVNSTCTQFNRGTVFVTADGTAATFISDTDIYDYQWDNTGDISASGYMMTKDGTRYRIDGGNVTWMRDRNGNKLTFTYDIAQRMTSVTDSLNRQVTISYNTYDQITFKGFGGATRAIKVYFAAVSNVIRSDLPLLTVRQMFPELNGASSGYYNAAVVSAIELPNGQQYQFRYNTYAELARVVLPTGGAIEYDYAAGLTDSATGSGILSGLAEKHVYRRLIERRVYPDGGSGSGYASRMTYSRPESSSTNAGYVQTDQYNASGTLLTRANHYFYGSARASFFKQPTEYPAWTDGREYRTDTFAADGSTVLRRLERAFEQRAAVSWWTGGAATAPPNDVRTAETVTTLLDSNQVAKQTFGYDDTVPFNNQNNLKEYDYGNGVAGPLMRETRTTYLTGSSYTGASVHLRNLAIQASIYDSGGTERARTTYEYDNYATDTNRASLTDRAGISGFDASFNTSYTTRGNVTGTTRYLLSGGSVTGSISAYAQYDIAGNTIKSIDPRGYITELYYTDCYGGPDGDARTNTAPGDLSGLSSYGFVTSTKNHFDQRTYSQFDFSLGEPVDGEDSNGVVTSGSYNDSLDRPTQLRRAAGTAITNQTTFTYDDLNRVVTTSSDRDANNDSMVISSVLSDQMGRAIETRQYEGGTNYIATQSQYDVLGRAEKTSRPFRPWLSETPVWDTTGFDALGRPISITTPDSAVVSTSYNGNSVTVTDPAGKKKKSVTDALGRLRQVYEDPDSLNYLTSYDYDVLDGLTTITQGTQTRTFAFDSLKRLLSATNPENGTVSYQYDNNSNMVVKTDARGVSTHLAYDALNRLTRRWYNGSNSTSATTHNSPVLPSGVGASDEANFYYDAQSLPSGAPTFSRGSSIGRQVAVLYGTGSSTTGDYFGYDSLGRVVLKIQRMDTSNYQTTATYNLANGTTVVNYPSGHTANYSYDSAGRTTNFSGNLGDGITRTYASTFVYNPSGQVTQELFGTATPLYHKLQYNIRSQLWDIRVSTGADINGSWNRGALQYFYDSSLGYGSSGPDNNGNLRLANTYIPLDEQVNGWAIHRQAYTYDALNRVTSTTEHFVSNTQAESQQSVQSYTYDRWGNRTINAGSTNGAGINNKVFTVNSTNNRLGVPSGQSGAMDYDAAGNLTNDTYSGAGNRTYDAENKIRSAWGGNNQAQLYAYDASGQRIKRTVDGVETWQIYGIDGELLAEYAANGLWSIPQKEYGYRNGELLITGTSAPRVNVAASANGGTATASETNSAPYAASGALNGDRKYYLNNAWANSTATFPQWLQVDFNGSKTIDEIDVFSVQNVYNPPSEPTPTMTFNTYGLTTFEAQYWNGASWVTVPGGSVTGNNKVWKQLTFTPITTTKIRIWITGSSDGYSRMTEVEAWGTSPPVTRQNVAAVANGGTATASETNSAPYAPSGALNGDRKYYLNNAWANSTASFPQWLQVDFNGSKTIDEIDVFSVQNVYNPPSEPTPTMTFNTYGLTTFEAQYWNGASWVTVPGGSVTGNNKVWKQLTFTPITTTKIRIWITGSSDGYSRMTEVEAWGVPSGSGGSSDAGIKWLVMDPLGTPRMIIDQSGSLAGVKRHDYLPFGEELFAGTGGRTTALGYTSGDGVRQQFTQKERDNETGLDYFLARYYSSNQGRFTSPDEFTGGPDELYYFADDSSANPTFYADLRKPQSLNKYQYSYNNPLRYTDPDGHDPEDDQEPRPVPGQALPAPVTPAPGPIPIIPIVPDWIFTPFKDAIDPFPPPPKPIPVEGPTPVPLKDKKPDINKPIIPPDVQFRFGESPNKTQVDPRPRQPEQMAKGGKRNVRNTKFDKVSDADVSRRARNKSLPARERREYQTEEKARGIRNKGKRKDQGQ